MLFNILGADASAPITAGPSVTVNKASGQADPTSASPILFDIVFSEPITNFIDIDLNYAGTTAGGTKTAVLSGGPTTWSASISGMTTAGDLVVNVPAGAVNSIATGAPNLLSTSTDNVVAWNPTLWTPASLGAALRLWGKADTGLTLTGTLIDQANDLSGNNFHLYSNTTHRPVRDATAYNGLPAVRFNVASQTFLSTQDVIPADRHGGATGLGSASSWFFIGQMNGGTVSYARAFSYLGANQIDTNPGGAVDYAAPGCLAAILRDGTTNALSFYQATSSGASGAVPLDTNVRVLMTFDGTNARLYVNNVLVGGPTGAAFTLENPGVITIGANPQGSSGSISASAPACFQGFMAEWGVTNTALNSTERNDLDAYFVARLGA